MKIKLFFFFYFYELNILLENFIFINYGGFDINRINNNKFFYLKVYEPTKIIQKKELFLLYRSRGVKLI